MKLLLMVLVLGASHGHSASSFPHSGDACKDACAMTKMACEDQCDKEKDPAQARSCRADCAEQVSSCQQTCPAAMEKAHKQMKDQGLPEPSPQGH